MGIFNDDILRFIEINKIKYLAFNFREVITLITVITIMIAVIQCGIAYFAYRSEVKFSKMSNDLDNISVNYAKKSFELSQKYGECDFNINSNNSDANKSSTQRMSISTTSPNRVGITITFVKEFNVKNGALKKLLVYSKTNQNFKQQPEIFLCELNETNEDRKFFKANYNIYLDKESNGENDVIFGHFFEILIDSSNRVHYFLNEVLFKGRLSSSTIKKNANGEIESMSFSFPGTPQKNQDSAFQIGYRTYDEAEILAFRDRGLKKKWIVKKFDRDYKENQRLEISNYGKVKENLDPFISSYEFSNEYLKQINKELEDIKSRVTLLGFKL